MNVNKTGGSSSVYLLPGMSVKLKVTDFFVRKEDVYHKFQDGTAKITKLTNGFVLDDDNVGDMTPVDGEASVVYKHKKFELNEISFYAITGEKGMVSIMSVPIHDHSSIVAGGPAYGTYYTDDETVADDDAGSGSDEADG